MLKSDSAYSSLDRNSRLCGKDRAGGCFLVARSSIIWEETWVVPQKVSSEWVMYPFGGIGCWLKDRLIGHFPSYHLLTKMSDTMSELAEAIVILEHRDSADIAWFSLGH